MLVNDTLSDRLFLKQIFSNMKCLLTQGDRQLRESVTSLENESIKLQAIDVGIERVRKIARQKRKGHRTVVDEFIAERRAEAAQD